MAKWQDPKIETMKDSPKPFYYIRPYVPQLGPNGMERRRKRIALGYCEEMTKREAKARKQEIMAPINQGKFILQAQISFSVLVEQYRKTRLPAHKASTRETYDRHLENHILPAFANCQLADVNRQAIETWLMAEAKPHEHARYHAPGQLRDRLAPAREEKPAKHEGLGWWALKDLRKILSAVFSAAMDWGLWPSENPCARVKVARGEPKRKKVIPQAEDLQKFLAALPDTAVLPAESARLVVLTAVVAGLRVSEVLALEPGDVDLAKQTITVSRRWYRGDMDTTKSRESKRIRQVGALAEVLVAHGKDKQFLFEREPGLAPDDRDLQQHVFRPAAQAVNIYFEGFGMHTFRRLNVSWRQEAGATPFEAMKAAGHAKPDMTWLYTVTDAGREREHVAAILKRAMPELGKGTASGTATSGDDLEAMVPGSESVM